MDLGGGGAGAAGPRVRHVPRPPSAPRPPRGAGDDGDNDASGAAATADGNAEEEGDDEEQPLAPASSATTAMATATATAPPPPRRCCAAAAAGDAYYHAPHPDFPLSHRRPQRAPLTLARFCVALFMVPIVLGVFALSWRPMVQLHGGNALIMVPFHVLLLLSLTSYWHVVSVDPGTVPEAWHEAVAAASGGASAYPQCRRTHKHLPLRAHYEAVTGRVILNLDHFCPWVANSVGFYNRKFFILFCLYSALAAAFAGLVLLPDALGAASAAAPAAAASPTVPVPPHALKPALGSPMDRAWVLLATVLDLSFAVCLLLFAVGHLYMAARNQTSLEDADESARFHRGWRENLQSVLGADPRCWFVPLWGSGPLGDGVHWRLSTGRVVGVAAPGAAYAASSATGDRSKVAPAGGGAPEGGEGEGEGGTPAPTDAV